MRAHRCIQSAHAQQGIALIIVLIMTVIIGLTAASSMRASISSERVVNNLRSEGVAQQYAEAALKYCENETAKASGARIAQLADGQLTTIAAGGTPNWTVAATWINPTNGRVEVPENQIKTTESSFAPTQRPECFVEIMTLADGQTAWLITARGFSLDYARDSSSGRTTAGSVVWLQSYRTRN